MFILTHRKRCSRCGESKPFSEFFKHKYSKDGHVSACKDCTHKDYISKIEQKHAYDEQYRLTHKEKISQKNKKHREQNAEKLKEHSRLWRLLHPGRVAELSKVWRKTNPDKAREAGLRWQRNNPERKSAYSHNRRAQKQGNRVTPDEWKAVLEKYGNKCLACGRTDVKLTMDHVVPLSRGGTHTADNLQPLCKPCNSRKCAKVEDYRGKK